MQELLAKLQQQLSDSGPVPPPVQDTMRQIDAALVGGGGQAPEKQPDSSSWLKSKGMIGALCVLAGTAGVGIGKIPWEKLSKLPLPGVTNTWLLLAIVATIGALTGLAHAFYRNKRSLLVPVITRDGGRIHVKTFGYLANVAAGSGVAVLTAWMAMSNVSAEAPPAVPPNLLSWNVLLSAVLAGVVGSRMASGDVETSALLKALSTRTESPAVPGLGKKVQEASTVMEAITVATGVPPPGFVPRTGTVADTSNAEKKLLALFEPKALKKVLTASGKPLDSSGGGLTLATLAPFQNLTRGLQNLLGDIAIAEVANLSPDAFAEKVERRGIDVTAVRPALNTLHGDAVQVMQLLRALPATWSLGPNRI